MNRQNILIIGGTGSLGSELVSYLESVVGQDSITIYSRDEQKQLQMMSCFPNIEYLIGDIRDKERLFEACSGKNLVINAAAIKHVVIAENNPEECFKTNFIGTQNVTQACIENNVEKSILISSDKAVNPIGIYGKSKEMAENVFLTANSLNQTKFSVIRFGNILCSRGSVVEIFKRDKQYGRLFITDENATRFFITKKEAVTYLIESYKKMSGGEIFAPQMKTFRVRDLAIAIAPEAKHELTGLRLGDRVHEFMQLPSGEVFSSESIPPIEVTDLIKLIEE